VILRAAIIAALAASLFAALQTWRVDRLRASVTEAERAFGICDATLTAYLEGEEIDNAIPDDLGDFVPPDHWLRPSTSAP
jgi:hypothetical protein